MTDLHRALVNFLEHDFSITEIDHIAWTEAEPVSIDRYWSGRAAPAARHAEANLLWSSNAFYVRFEALQSEALIISNNPDRSRKAVGLWDRDVCEIFVAAGSDACRKYLEFEVAPTGEWVDLAIEFQAGERRSDLSYSSGMQAFSRMENDKVISAIMIPWTAFGKTPKPGDLWRGNLFRCVGDGPERGYLAWQPTLTEIPNFHVPEKFGEFSFVD